MELPNNYLVFAAEVFSTMLGLLIALIYFYIKSASKWQLLIHNIQDELLAYRNKYLEEKKRTDALRELLQSKSSELERAITELAEAKKRANAELADAKKRGDAELAEAKKSVEEHLETITRLKEEIEELHQSEKLRSEIVNQLVTSKIQNEHLSAELEAHKKTATELKETIHNLEHEINVLGNQTQAEKTNEQGYTLKTNGEMDFNRLKARADKQAETIHNLELDLMKAAYKKPSKQAESHTREDAAKIHTLERMLNESETCVKLLESELTEQQDKIRTLEEELEAYKNSPQSSSDVQKLEQMLKESETCNTLLENELESLMQKIRILEGKEEPSAPPHQNYEI